MAIVKCMLHISPEEQKERLIARLDDPTKRWKYNPRDLEDRALWDDYMAAYADVLERCNTDAAPWHVVPADRKWYRNWAITQLLCEQLEELGLRWPEPAFDVAEEQRRLRKFPRVRKRGSGRRRGPGARVPDREAAHDAGRLSPEPQLAAGSVQPVHEPRPGRRLRRGTIRDALHRLARRRWTRFASGARAAKYRHLLDENPGLSVDQQALLAVLMLRGRRRRVSCASAGRPAVRVPGRRDRDDAAVPDRARLRRAARAPAGAEGGALRAPAERGPRGRAGRGAPPRARGSPPRRAAPGESSGPPRA